MSAERVTGAPWADAAERTKHDLAAVDAETALRDELVNLWHDLYQAQREAYNGQWSSGCDWYAERIVTLTRIVGVTSWEQIQVDLLVNGTYEGLLNAAGFDYPDLNWSEILKLQARNRSGALRT